MKYTKSNDLRLDMWIARHEAEVDAEIQKLRQENAQLRNIQRLEQMNQDSREQKYMTAGGSK